MNTSTTGSTYLHLAYNVHRWYEPQTGRYSSADPLGVGGTSRSGLNLLFAYAGGNPLRFSDALGLWRTENCNRDQTKAIASAIIKAKHTLRDPSNPCELCKNETEKMVSSISDSTFFCASTPNELTAHRMPLGCGSVYDAGGQKGGADKPVIALTFYDPNGVPPLPPMDCGCLASSIVHEAAHNALGVDHFGSNAAQNVESRCNACKN